MKKHVGKRSKTITELSHTYEYATEAVSEDIIDRAARAYAQCAFRAYLKDNGFVKDKNEKETEAQK